MWLNGPVEVDFSFPQLTRPPFSLLIIGSYDSGAKMSLRGLMPKYKIETHIYKHRDNKKQEFQLMHRAIAR